MKLRCYCCGLPTPEKHTPIESLTEVKAFIPEGAVCDRSDRSEIKGVQHRGAWFKCELDEKNRITQKLTLTNDWRLTHCWFENLFIDDTSVVHLPSVIVGGYHTNVVFATGRVDGFTPVCTRCCSSKTEEAKIDWGMQLFYGWVLLCFILLACFILGVERV